MRLALAFCQNNRLNYLCTQHKVAAMQYVLTMDKKLHATNEQIGRKRENTNSPTARATHEYAFKLGFAWQYFVLDALNRALSAPGCE